MSKTLVGKHVVVVGGSSGIGEAVAFAAQEAGARVLALGRSGRAPQGVAGIAVDVRDHEALAANWLLPRGVGLRPCTGVTVVD